MGHHDTGWSIGVGTCRSEVFMFRAASRCSLRLPSVTHRLLGSLLIGLSSVLAGCGGGGDPVVTPPAVVALMRLSPPSLELEPGQSAPITATAVDANGATVPGQTVSWGSSQPAVATVTAAGVVTAVADGTAAITASVGSAIASATVTVRSRVASITVTPPTAELTLGRMPLQLVAQPRSASGAALDRPVQWTSQNPAIASVTASGLVTAVATGSTTITATSDGTSGSAAVQVLSDPCSVVRGVQLGQSVSGTLSAADCLLDDNTPIQVYEFILSAPAKIEIQMNSTIVDPYLFLADATLNVLEEDDDGGVGLNARILRSLPAGRYFVFANTYAAGSFGAYQLVVQPAPAACVIGRATAIPSTTDAQLGTASCLQRDGSYEDRFDLVLTQSTTLRVDMTSTAFDPSLVLLDATELVIAKDNDGGLGTNARLDVDLAAGRYTVLARGRTSSGAYRLQVAPLADPCDVTRVLAFGQPVQDAFAAGNCAPSDPGGGPVRYFQRFGLALAQSGPVQIDLTSTAVDAYLLLQDAATGAIVAENDDASPGTLNARIVAQLPAGAYIVNATTYGTGETGPFQLTAIQVPPQNITIAASPSSLSLQPGQTQQLTATVSGTTNTAVSWSSSASGVASVSSTGLVRAITPGSATITVSSLADPSRTAVVAVSVTQNASTVNLDIAAAYLVQSVQQLDGRVPLVSNRSAVARVFVRGSQNGLSPVPVRVRVLQGSSVLGTYTATASPRQTLDESCCSANVAIPASVIRPGISLLAEVDPDQTVPESNESDNAFPLSGTPQPLTVVQVPTYDIRLVPVAQQRNGQVGSATESMFNVLRSIWPLNVINVSVRQALVIDYTIGTQTFDDWIRLVTDLERVRQIEGGATYYYGLVRTTGGGGVLGLANGIPARTAIGVDEGSQFGAEEARLTFAHEMGHTLGLRHAPCGGAAGPDPNYPFPDGRTGSFGLDIFGGNVLKPPTGSDIMSYCPNQWVSAYNYRRVLDHRQQFPEGPAAVTSTSVLLVSGIVAGGALTVDPVFSLAMPAASDDPTGRYVIEAFDQNDALLLAHRFSPWAVADAASGTEAFVRAVPVPEALQALVARVAVRDLSGAHAATRRSTQVGATSLLGTGAMTTRRERAGALTATWSPARVPSVLVRDRLSGEVLAIVRDGSIDLSQFGDVGRLELHLSNGVRSERTRIDRVTGAIRP
jgi:uncharacterized protein YjdB